MNYTERNRLLDKLSAVGLMLLFVEIIFLVANELLGGTLGRNGMLLVGSAPTILNVVSGIFLLIGIVVLIISYKKEDLWKGGFGIEFIILAFASLFLLHAYVDLPAPINQLKWKVIIPVAFAVYYVIKAIYVIIKANKKR